MTYPPEPANSGYPTDSFRLASMAGDPPKRKRSPFALLAALLLLAAPGTWWLTRPQPPPASWLGQTIVAGHAACEEAVRERLKAPGTAKFGGRDHRAIQNGYAYELVGWVDAENGFGALVRNRYVCEAFEGETGWRVSKVTFSDW